MPDHPGLRSHYGDHAKTTRKVVSRQEAFRLVETIGSCTLTEGRVPEVQVDGDRAEPGDVADVLAAFGRKVARQSEALPESVSDDARVREAVRVRLDRIQPDCALIVERTGREIGAAR